MTFYTVQLVAVFLTGAALGLFYFGGLWLTIRRIPNVQQPGMLLLVSYVVRIAVVMLAFFFVMAGEWERIIACLAGFLVMRTCMIHRIQPVNVVRSTSRKMSP